MEADIQTTLKKDAKFNDWYHTTIKKEITPAKMRKNQKYRPACTRSLQKLIKKYKYESKSSKDKRPFKQTLAIAYRIAATKPGPCKCKNQNDTQCVQVRRRKKIL